MDPNPFPSPYGASLSQGYEFYVLSLSLHAFQPHPTGNLMYYKDLTHSCVIMYTLHFRKKLQEKMAKYVLTICLKRHLLLHVIILSLATGLVVLYISCPHFYPFPRDKHNPRKKPSLWIHDIFYC